MDNNENLILAFKGHCKISIQHVPKSTASTELTKRNFSLSKCIGDLQIH